MKMKLNERNETNERGNLREGREVPPRRCLHPCCFRFHFRFNFRYVFPIFSGHRWYLRAWNLADPLRQKETLLELGNLRRKARRLLQEVVALWSYVRVGEPKTRLYIGARIRVFTGAIRFFSLISSEIRYFVGMELFP